ncbi:hypothetical protein G3N55_09170 [Dissulfurirhabdus thermomarina]|uniref:Uncharacterized protein n=1 Tax=Dissulfurirhabdus thermomarina TaxID=1765737 RepID=A0A6N9TRF3_DISTH|nr:hypothetical protein [Dissulfurirhabdus thermomarina]NDY43010.1 hypothetical protein [Dissulfurirhabdus thermomarina]NMX23831.1 hypothetical protein [Dissulfurirhabdus thermomarina]
MRPLVLGLLGGMWILVLAGGCLAEEMVIRLQSGNSIRITYHGLIDQVTFEGKGDAITGVVLPQPPDRHPEEGGGPAAGVSGEGRAPEKGKGEKAGGERWIRLKWAKPIDDY